MKRTRTLAFDSTVTPLAVAPAPAPAQPDATTSTVPQPPAMAERVRVMAASKLRGSVKSKFVSLAGDAYAKEVFDLDVWALTQSQRVVIPTRSMLLSNVLKNLAGAAARHAELQYDEGDLRWLSSVEDDYAAQFQSRCADEHGRQFEVLPEQLALAMSIVRGPMSTFRPTGSSRAWCAPQKSPCATFSILSSAPGSGKTAVVIMAALHGVGDGWAACRDTFSQWKLRPVNNDPTTPLGIVTTAGDSTAVARAAFIVTTRATHAQWLGAVTQTLALVPNGPNKPQLVKKPLEALESCVKSQRPIISVVMPSVLKRYYKERHTVGVAFLAMDEIATHAAELPTGHNFGQKPVASVYRMVGMSATLMRMFEGSTPFLCLGGGNLLKSVMCGDPSTRVPLRGVNRTITWRRVSLATVAPAMQLSLSEELASRCTPVVTLRNLRITADTLFNKLSSWTTHTPRLGAAMRLTTLTPGPTTLTEADRNVLLLMYGQAVAAALAGAKMDKHRPVAADCIATLITAVIAGTCDDHWSTRAEQVKKLMNGVKDAADWVNAGEDVDESELSQFTLMNIALFGKRTCRARLTHCGYCGCEQLLMKMRVCRECTTFICEACVAAEPVPGPETPPGCLRCCPASPAADVRAAERSRTLGMMEGLSWALGQAAGGGGRRVLVFGTMQSMTTMLAEAARLAGVALHTPVDVGEYKNVPVAAGNTMVMYIPDTEEAGEMLTGLNLGNTDAIIAVNRLSDEQQAFSRAIRMLPPGAAVPANLPIYRLLSNYEPAGELCDPEKLPEPADAVDVGSEGEDLEFATKALQSCCTPEEKVMTDMDTELFEQLPSRLVLVIEPTAVCARMVEYELEADGEQHAEWATFELVFKRSVEDPFVPADAAGLRVWNQDGRVRACWVQASRQPTVQHPDVPVNRMRVIVESATGVVMQTLAQVGDAA